MGFIEKILVMYMYMNGNNSLTYSIIISRQYGRMHQSWQNILKALFNNVSTLKNLSCMFLHVLSVFHKV